MASLEIMIVSASYKTDIPAFYPQWFRQRLAAGHVRVTNPWSGKPFDVDLRPEAVGGFVFWTRNLAPFSGAVAEVAARPAPFVLHQTITGYPAALERATPPAARATAQLRWLAEGYGRATAVWRYDPILLSDLTPPDWHLANFAALADSLAGAVDEVVVSFLAVYRKTRRNLDSAAAAFGFSWRDPEMAERAALTAELAEIAAARGLRLTLCSQPELLAALPAETPVSGAACIDTARLERVRQQLAPDTPPASAHRAKQTRPGCACAASKDIGGYDTCPHGCYYCYAVRDHERVRHPATNSMGS